MKNIDLDNYSSTATYLGGLFEFDKLINSFREKFFIVFLSSSNEIISKELISSNFGLSTKVKLEKIAEKIQMHNPSKILLTHNHPNNDVFPSFSDVFATRKIQELAIIQNVELEDHIILSKKGKYFSFKEKGMLIRIFKSVKSELNQVL